MFRKNVIIFSLGLFLFFVIVRVLLLLVILILILAFFRLAVFSRGLLLAALVL